MTAGFDNMSKILNQSRDGWKKNDEEYNHDDEKMMLVIKRTNFESHSNSLMLETYLNYKLPNNVTMILQWFLIDFRMLDFFPRYVYRSVLRSPTPSPPGSPTR